MGSGVFVWRNTGFDGPRNHASEIVLRRFAQSA
jgi:hypothetical protein